jgi:hypothetical protein
MRRNILILLILCFPVLPAVAQKTEFGIRYTPINFTKLTFDQDFIVFQDYTSLRITEKYFMSFPSLSNSGLYVKFPLRRLALETGLNFQNNTYFYGKRITYQNANVSFFYSSIDIPVSAVLTLNPDNILKLRLVAGMNSKFFKIRRNYYSIFAKGFDYFFYSEEYKSDKDNRDFMVEKVNPFILYSRVGAGLEYFQWTLDLYVDKNLTGMNVKKDSYNANFMKSGIVSIALGFQFARGNMSDRNSSRITKE